MAKENASKRAFHEDIFAEDNDKWSWPASGPNAKASSSGSNYCSQSGLTTALDSSSRSSSEELTFRCDSNSLKRSFRKRGSSSESEEHPQEDVSSSPGPASLPSARRPPSIYDDDAQSGSPSGTYEKKDLAFISSFKKDFYPLPNKKSRENSPIYSPSSSRIGKYDKEHSFDGQNSKHSSLSPHNESPVRGSKDNITKKASSESSRPSVKRSESSDKKYPPPRSRTRSRSKEPRAKSPRSNRNHSRSKERHSQKVRRRHSRSSHSRYSHRRSRSHSRDTRKRSRSRSREVRRRSRSRSYDRDSRRSRYRSSSIERYRRRRYSRSRSHSRDRSNGRSGSSHHKPGSLPLSTSGGTMTPQMALQQTMAAMSAKAQALTGIALPKYYNPAAVNPLKYAEQVQKRKLLWQTKDKVEEVPKNSVWDKLTFAQDQDGKMTAKFRKLMGIKSEGAEAKEIQEQEEKESVLKKQEELFRDLDQQYEMARMTTHTQRGVGLGYSAQALYPPLQK